MSPAPAMGKDPVISHLLGIAIEPTYFDLEHCELDPSQVVRTVKNAGANAMRLGMFSHQGHTYYPSRVAPEAPFLDGRHLLHEFEDECRKAGIALVVYLNSKWVTDLYSQHPDWVIRFKDGVFRHPDGEASLTIYPMCPNSPFMQYFKRIVKEVVTVSRPDAVYIDNFAIEPFCECDHCRKTFRGKIPERSNWNSPDTQKYVSSLISRSRTIARSIVSTARSRDPGMPVVFNRGQFWSETGLFSPEDNYEYAHKIGSAVHAESAVRLYGESFEHINEQCTFGRSIDLPIWTWVEYPMLPFSYVPPSKEEALIKAAKVIANGGRPMVWSMPCAPLVDQKGMSGIRDVFELVSAHRDAFNDVSFDRFAGIVFSSSSLRVHCQGKRERLKEYRNTFAGAQELLLRNHLPYDFVLDDRIVLDVLRRYRLIILPNVIYLNRYQCDEIKQYVRSGGAVMASHETSLYSRHGRRLKDFALRDVFGASYVRQLGEQLEGYSAGYSRFTADHPINKNGLREPVFPVGGRYLAVESADQIAKLLARCRYYCDHLQPETDYPAVVARSCGQGKVVYIPGEFFKTYHDRGFLEYSKLFMQSVEWFVNGRMPLVTDVPDTVEVSIAKNKKGHKVIHVVNCSFDKARPIKQIIPAAGTHLKIRTSRKHKKVVDISTGESLKFRHEKGYLQIDLPLLTGYNVVVAE